MNNILKTVTLIIFCSMFFTVSAAELKATKQQTEEWLEQHVQSWDDGKRVYLTAKGCKLHISTKNNNSIINMKGVLFPIEVLAIGNSRSPRVRIRVKDRYTGDYGMIKECPDNSGRVCKNSNQKWQPLSYYDLVITHQVEYFGRDEDLNDRKATSMRNAIEHYAKLCGAQKYEYLF